MWRHDFNPRSPCGERRLKLNIGKANTGFQSTLPVWGATQARQGKPGGERNFNPRSPCGERPAPCRFWWSGGYFNPRSPCGERPCRAYFSVRIPGFQSTLPVWGATVAMSRSPCTPSEISIHAPRVGSDVHAIANIGRVYDISIHAPRVGSDVHIRGGLFLPHISIHAPRVGSDSALSYR